MAACLSVSDIRCVYLLTPLELFGHIDTRVPSFAHLMDHVFLKPDVCSLVIALSLGVYLASGFICYFIYVIVVPFSVSIVMGMMNVTFAAWGSIAVLGEY